MKPPSMTHHRSDRHLYYPVDLPRLARHLEQHAIDIADIAIEKAKDRYFNSLIHK